MEDSHRESHGSRDTKCTPKNGTGGPEQAKASRGYTRAGIPKDAVRRNLWRGAALWSADALWSPCILMQRLNCAYRETAELIAGHSGGRAGERDAYSRVASEGRGDSRGNGRGDWNPGGVDEPAPAFLGHVPMGIGISGCVNTSLSRRIEREQSETLHSCTLFAAWNQ